ncbi:MAG: hypothetical protein HFF69_13795 [Oscillospiraceae bacterium]|nr:hypothetical protein [Oscillospiraceae bacterium]
MKRKFGSKNIGFGSNRQIYVNYTSPLPTGGVLVARWESLVAGGSREKNCICFISKKKKKSDISI